MTIAVNEAHAPSADHLRPGPGRPRVAGLDELMLEATVELLDAGEQVTVSKVVERSGVSRATLYRRWTSITLLIAAALDVGRTKYPVVLAGDDLKSAVIGGFLPDSRYGEFPMSRFKQRLKLIIEYPVLQREYWESHVARRRAPLEETLREAVASGKLHRELDVAASVDAIAGVFYYQLVVRGADLADPETMRRMKEALDIIWRGML